MFALISMLLKKIDVECLFTFFMASHNGSKQKAILHAEVLLACETTM